MSEEKVTYMELKLPNSKKQKYERRPANKKKEKGVSWHITALIMGILCFLLLLTTTGCIYLLKSCSCKGKDLTRNYPNSSEAENHDIVSTPTVPYHIVVPVQDKQDQPDVCLEKWSCCGKDCYYYSKEEKTWNESKKFCQDHGSDLVKIDDANEQSFIRSRISYNYWVGLYKKGDKVPWLWSDGTQYSQKLNFKSSKHMRGESCGYVKKSHIDNAACTRTFPYICEKKSKCRDN